MKEQNNSKTFKVARAADSLSLGISMVVAVAIGTGLGVWLRQYWGNWVLFCGIALGVLAAINNVFKAYKAQKASYDELGDTHAIIKPNSIKKTAQDDDINKNI
ncbi:AtpZ/AtpI family protein [Campylobacter sp.]|uniref:AtpZ/AtpI family protein n=1 Tax=Campylobacter sp. TaxID=205 RepID=UPI002AA73EDC|nr:AtpZ/AtpI family protein [Campylobacter sp.]MCI7237087.1 AtpZ/AtpI family protein [Campylobacter sp.]